MPDRPFEIRAFEIRQDLRDTHQRILDHIARPGSWFDGADRVEIARAARAAADCKLCRDRKAALSPDHVDGVHDGNGALPEALIDLVHRVRTDPGRVSQKLVERTRAAGIGEGPYVEAVGITALTAGLDFDCRALGVPALTLPDPLPGEPDGHRPEGLVDGIAWVPLLPPENATGPEADLYGELAMVPNIIRALSSVPAHVRALMDWMGSHYVSIADLEQERAIDRLQIELVAARVSATNECFY